MFNQALPVDPFLFTKSLEFAGVFRDAELATKPISVEILYSPLNTHPPIGTIRGTVADWHGLESFFRERKSSLCELENISAAEGGQKIHSKHVLLREISCRHPDDKSETIQQLLGYFEPLEVTTDQNFGQRDTSNREMTFLVRGPTLIWMSDAIRSFSYLGSTRTEFPNYWLPIPCVKDMRIAARPHFLYVSPSEAERLFRLGRNGHLVQGTARLSVEAEAFGLTLTDCDLERPDADFETRALEIAETLCLLVSFLSKADITWYARTLWSGGRLCETYRNVRQVPTSPLWWEDVVLYPKDVRTFISRAFVAYDERAKEGVNLRLPVLLYVAAQSAPVIEERFILLFRCLEKLVDMLDRTEMLSQNELTKLAKFLRAKLREMGKDHETVVAVDEKKKELMRPALRRRLSQNLARLKIDLVDIGGESSLGKIRRVRDSLIHAADEPAISQIVEEDKRLETVVERVLLSLLDWRGPTNTPTLRNRSVLARTTDG